MPDCRDDLVAVARAGLSVLADYWANSDERKVAAEVVTEAVETLRLPSDTRANPSTRTS